MVDTKSALVAETTTPMESLIDDDVNTTPTTTATKTTNKIDNTHRKVESIAQGSNAVLTIKLPDQKDSSAHNISCSVTLAGVTRNLGNWTETRTAVLQLSSNIREIFGHRLTVSFQKNVVSISLVNVTFSDSGIYSCASSATQKTDIDLRVTGGPFIVSRSFPDSVTIKESKTSVFEMFACGNPKPSVKWTLSNDSASIDGVAVKGTYGYRSEQITQKYSLNTHCYKYTYETPKVYRQPCNLTANFQAHGDSVNPVLGTVAISVSFIPERVTDVRSKIMDGEQCIVTRWNGPLLNPNHCRIRIDYHVEVVGKTLSPVVFKTYSNNFMICRDDLGVSSLGDVLGVRVRYSNEFGHGEYVSTNFVTDFAKKVEVVSLVEPAQNDDDNYKNIAITTSGLLGLFVLVIIVFITYYACANWNGSSCCCGPCIGTGASSVEDGLTTDKTNNKKKTRKYTISKKRDNQPTPNTPSSSKTPRKNRIRKETIIPKPKSLAQVTSHGIGIHKSATFSGYDSFQNPHATTETTEETLQKGYMPLNTLQRRISESLAAVNAPQNRVSSIPVFEDIFENSHAEVDDNDSEVDDDIYNQDDDDGKRNSGASAETECTSLGSRTTLDNIGHHATLRHTHSLEFSDYDMPYVIDLDKAASVISSTSASRRKQSLYDHLPRSQTFHGGVRPSRFNRTAESSEDGMSQKSEYAHPSVAFGGSNHNVDSTDATPMSLRDKRKSVYQTPRRSMLQLNVEDLDGNNGGNDTPKKKSSYTDDKVIYDKPKQVLPPQEPQSGTPAASKPEGFAPPVISQITGLYDTPRIHASPSQQQQQPTEQPKETISTTNTNPSEGVNTLEPPSNASSETLYDNINFILTKYGCTSNDTAPTTTTSNINNDELTASQNVYDQLPTMSNDASDVDCRPAKRGTEC